MSEHLQDAITQLQARAEAAEARVAELETALIRGINRHTETINERDEARERAEVAASAERAAICEWLRLPETTRRAYSGGMGSPSLAAAAIERGDHAVKREGGK